MQKGDRWLLPRRRRLLPPRELVLGRAARRGPALVPARRRAYGPARRGNQDRLRELARRRSRLDIFCAHDAQSSSQRLARAPIRARFRPCGAPRWRCCWQPPAACGRAAPRAPASRPGTASRPTWPPCAPTIRARLLAPVDEVREEIPYETFAALWKEHATERALPGPRPGGGPKGGADLGERAKVTLPDGKCCSLTGRAAPGLDVPLLSRSHAATPHVAVEAFAEALVGRDYDAVMRS